VDKYNSKQGENHTYCERQLSWFGGAIPSSHIPEDIKIDIPLLCLPFSIKETVESELSFSAR